MPTQVDQKDCALYGRQLVTKRARRFSKSLTVSILRVQGETQPKSAKTVLEARGFGIKGSWHQAAWLKWRLAFMEGGERPDESRVRLGGADSAVFRILERYREEQDPQRLGDLVRELTEHDGFSDLQPWISQYATSWLRERKPALAAVVEAAVYKSLPGAYELIRDVLSAPDADLLVLSVAAQRIRFLPTLDAEQRSDLWDRLEALIQSWESISSQQGHLALAVRSIPYVGGADSVGLIERLIESGSDIVAHSAALGLLDWSAGSIRNIEALQDATAQRLHGAVLHRLNKTTPGRPNVSFDLFAALLWVLGALARKEQIAVTASVVAKAFARGNGFEDAAAVRAGRLLLRRFPDRVISPLVEAFGGIQSTDFAEFLKALVETAH